MKSALLITSALATGVFAWPKPLIDLDLNLLGTVTVTATVSVTVPASTCSPALSTGKPVGPPLLIRTSSTPAVLPGSSAAPAQLSTSKPPLPSLVRPTPLPLQTGKPTPTPLPLPTNKPAPVVQSSATPLPQSTPKPSLVVPTPAASSSGIRPTGTSQALLSIGASYQAAILFHHNTARANHGAAPLVWDTSCEANARLAAETCNYGPYLPAGVIQGQNFYLSGSDAFNVTAAITETWYKNELVPARSWLGIATWPLALLSSVGDLTQLLWKSTTRVGCASVDCGTRMKVAGQSYAANKYTVCNYAVRGNVAGQFALNVGLPLSNILGKWTD